MGEDRGHVGALAEGQRAGEAFEEQAAERVLVGAAVELVAADLLGRHVVDGAHELPVGGVGAVAGVREPEVGEVGVIAVALLVEQDVARLDVAVHQPAPVGGVERFGDLRGDGDGPLGAERSAGSQQGLEVGAVDVAHRDEQPAIDLAGVVDGDDVRVVEARRQPRLVQEPLAEALVLREALGQHLERHRAAQTHVAREVDLAHAAPSDPLPDLVDAEHGPFERVWLTHRLVPSCTPSPTRTSAATAGRSGAPKGARPARSLSRPARRWTRPARVRASVPSSP